MRKKRHRANEEKKLNLDLNLSPKPFPSEQQLSLPPFDLNDSNK